MIRGSRLVLPFVASLGYSSYWSKLIKVTFITPKIQTALYFSVGRSFHGFRYKDFARPRHRSACRFEVSKLQI